MSVALVAAVTVAGCWTVTARSSPAPTTATLQSDRVAGAVYTGDFPDPSVLVVDGRYYAYATQSGGTNIQVVSSTDLTGWTPAADALPTLPTWAEPGFTWAPAVDRDPDGGYEMFFAARDGALGVECIGRAVSTSPLGPFVEASATPFLCQANLGGSIDPYVFTDGGTTYLLWKSDGANGSAQQIWSQALDADHDAPVGSASLLLSATSTWEQGVIEGPAMLRTENGLFLYFSGNSWSTSAYSIGVVGCDSPLGPCVNASTGQEVSTSGRVVGPGGATFFAAPDGDTYLAFAAWVGVPHAAGSRRELYIDEVDTTGTLPTLTHLLVPATRETHRSP
jgi:beta-xylosidase